MTASGKLVRDRIPEIVRASGSEPATRQLLPQERLPALLAKLLEESDELVEAASLANQTEELADIYEVLSALVVELGLSWEEIEHCAGEKREARGGFRDGIWMELG